MTDGAETARLLAGWTNLALSLEPGAMDLENWASGSGAVALAGPVSLWVGSEFDGLDAHDRAVCGQAVVLPMEEGHDSLNAAVAAGIALYRLRSSVK